MFFPRRAHLKEKQTVQFITSTNEEADSGFCERNLNLLAHAQAIELDIGSLCGGHGVCGGDRVKVISTSQLSPVTEAEKKHLAPHEISEGWRLACQCFPEYSDQLVRLKMK